MSRRLLYIVNEASYFLSHRLPLAKAAQAAGWEVEVATAEAPEQAEIAAAGFVIHSLPLSRSGLRLDRELRALLATWRLLRRIRPDLLHCVALKAVVLGGLAARLAGTPAGIFTIAGLGHVFVENGLANRLLRTVFRHLFPLLVTPNTRVIFQNPDDQVRLGLKGKLSRRQVLIAGSGVDLELFHMRPEPPGEVAIILPSRLLWTKGVGEFVEAARRLRAAGVPARFLLAGDNDPGNPASIPHEQLTAWSAEGAVEWLGFQQDMPLLLANCHIVCLPSFYGEGVPKCLIEGAATGRALVATDTPGCREIVRHGENGLLARPKDSEALAKALRQLIEDPDLRRRFGKRGREIAGDFGLHEVVPRTLALYDDVRQ